MKNQFLAIKRLQSRVAKVSCHYLISKKGKIYQLVKDMILHGTPANQNGIMT